MKKILFFIPNLSIGGAEKVLVNLVNNLDKNKFDITIQTLFPGGVNEQFLKENITIKSCFYRSFPGNSHVLKLFSPKFLFRMFVKEHYDIIVSYLEGPTARIVSGCNDKDTKTVCWIHIEQHSAKEIAKSFRNYKEAIKCYNFFDQIIGVSRAVKEYFEKNIELKRPLKVLYNTNESQEIIDKSQEKIEIDKYQVNIIGVGKIVKNKGFDRLARICTRLVNENYNVHIYILGVGPEEKKLQEYIKDNGIEKNFTLLGYQLNPYKYVSKCDMYVCSSYSEGFSTAATEALIVGTPVCTVEVAGMKEMLGENNEYGIICKNNEEALYSSIKYLLDNPDKLEHYKKQAEKRGKLFSTEKTVKAVEDMLESLGTLPEELQ